MSNDFVLYVLSWISHEDRFGSLRQPQTAVFGRRDTLLVGKVRTTRAGAPDYHFSMTVKEAWKRVYVPVLLQFGVFPA